MGGAAPRRFGHQADAGQVANRVGVVRADLPLAAHPLLQDAQLPASDGGSTSLRRGTSFGRRMLLNR
jgi:hypothetical protein